MSYEDFCRPAARPKVALLAHSEEWKTILELPKRVADQFYFVRDEFTRAGLEAQIVHEFDLGLNQKGQLCFDGNGEEVDLLMFVTVGTTFMDYPHLLKGNGPLRFLGTAKSEIPGC